MQNNVLVSVCVITYNSSKYVIETLESIKLQSYNNIEVIISDDCSIDDTVATCQNWINENAYHFKRIHLIQAVKNSGVAGNCNRAIQSANGVWIKCIAGDDLLFPNSIEEYMNFVGNNETCRICCSKAYFWGDDKKKLATIQQTYEKHYYPYLKMDVNSQLNKILRNLFVPGPGLFFQKQLWKDVNGFNEKYQFCEEYPFTLSVLEKGCQIFFIDKCLVKYQVRLGSLCNENGQLNYRTFWDFYNFFLDIRRQALIKNLDIFHALHESIVLYNLSLHYKRNSYFQTVIAKSLYILSPIAYYSLVKRLGRICRKSK